MIAVAASAALIALLAWRLRPLPPRLADTAPRPDASPTAVTDRPAGLRPRRARRPQRARERRRSAPDPAEVGEWCGRVSASCRSGATLTAALRAADPPATAETVVGELRLALDRGVSLVEAIDDRTAGEHLDVALTAMRACAASGAPAAEPLDRAAAALRARAAEAADRTTHSAQARLSAVVMTFLPAAMLLVLLVTSGAVRAAVLTPVGSSCVLGGAALNLVGWRWMRRIIDRAAR